MSTLPERIAEWTQTYCDTLTENYKQHSVRMHENFTSEWSKDQLESIKNGTANLTKFLTTLTGDASSTVYRAIDKHHTSS